MELRVVDVIKNIAEAVKTAEGGWITAEQMLERFLFSRMVQWTYVRKLSGGERRRLYLLSVLMREPNVLFLDEPTNDLDTETLSVLEEYLEHFPGVVITVSHDRYFLDRVVDHLLAFEDGGIIRFQGDYSDYLAQRKQQQSMTDAGKKADSNTFDSSARSRTERKRKLSYKEQKEWDEIEDRIASLEAKVGQLAKAIELAASDSERVQALFAEQQQTEEELERTVERWGELSLLVEELELDK
jgi:ATP-binding cassette subfamily F protein uup